MEFKYSFPPDFNYCEQPALWQNPTEWMIFAKLVESLQVKRYLAIGTGWGMDLLYMKEHLGLEVLGIDKQPLATPEGVTILKLDSQSPAAIRSAKEFNPDIVFIDGDHTLAGATWDYMNYGHLGLLVALHDISANPVGKFPTGEGVKQLWLTIKPFNRTIEIEAEQLNKCGIGCVIR